MSVVTESRKSDILIPDAAPTAFARGMEGGKENMIGERVREARQRLHLNQSELARKAELTPAAVCQIEKGERTPSAETLRSLAKSLDVTTDWLLGLSDRPQNLDHWQEGGDWYIRLPDGYNLCLNSVQGVDLVRFLLGRASSPERRLVDAKS